MKQYRFEPEQDFNLEVGDRLIIRDKILEGAEIVYAGMTENEKRYIINLSSRELLWFGTRQDQLYFPKEKKTFDISGIDFEVLDVNPFRISVRGKE